MICAECEYLETDGEDAPLCQKLYKYVYDDCLKMCPLRLPDTVEIKTETLCEWIRRLQCSDHMGDATEVRYEIQDFIKDYGVD